MNFHWPFAGKAEPLPHVVIRHVVATASDNSAASAKRRELRARLEAATAHLTAEERRTLAQLAGRRG